ncbi:hypothetical protein FQZ97_1153590 [compost metagenome]
MPAKLVWPVASAAEPTSRNSAGSMKAVNEASRAVPMPSNELPTSSAESMRNSRASPSV